MIKQVPIVSVAVLIAASMAAMPARALGQGTGGSLLAQVHLLQQQVKALQDEVDTLEAQVTNLQNNPVLALGSYVSVIGAGGTTDRGLAGPTVVFSGINVQIVNGMGKTASPNGLGNLVIGYDEDSAGPTTIDAARTGSHNLIVGPQHRFIASGALLGGYENFASANFASVTGGFGNTASGLLSSVTGGNGNTASSEYSSVTGGLKNTASSIYSSVTGGDGNTASGAGASSVTGGDGNTASGAYSSVTGGYKNTASGAYSSVGGGSGKTASGEFQSIN